MDSAGFMVWSNAQSALNSHQSDQIMLNWRYPPSLRVQVRLPIQARHNAPRYGHDGQQMGMMNKNGEVEDFSAGSTQQMVHMFLRNELDGTRTVLAVKAQMDSASMHKLVSVSSTNTHNQWLLCQVRYEKAQ